MKYETQQIFLSKKRVKVGRNKYRYLQIYDKRTVTKSGRVTNHRYYVKYKGVNFKIERIGFTQTYQIKGKL